MTRDHAAYRESMIYSLLHPKRSEEDAKVVALIMLTARKVIYNNLLPIVY
jgi:hypothetical protein